MAYVTSETPTGAEYYDVAALAVKQDPGRWRIIHSLTTKTWRLDPNASDVIGSGEWSTTPNLGGYRMAGYSYPVAMAIVRMLNNLAA